MEGPHSLLEVISDIGTVSTAFSHSPTAAIQVVGPGLIEINEQVDSSTCSRTTTSFPVVARSWLERPPGTR